MNEVIAPSAPFIAHGVLAIFGALVHAAKSYRDGTTRSIIDFIALTFMSSFSGVMFSLVGLELFGQSSYITLAMAGTGGFIGVEGMTFIIAYLTKRFGINIKSDESTTTN